MEQLLSSIEKHEEAFGMLLFGFVFAAAVIVALIIDFSNRHNNG